MLPFTAQSPVLTAVQWRRSFLFLRWRSLVEVFVDISDGEDDVERMTRFQDAYDTLAS